jgi:hypothetical protein
MVSILFFAHKKMAKTIIFLFCEEYIAMNKELERPYSISKYGKYTVQNEFLKEHIFHKTLLILI